MLDAETIQGLQELEADGNPGLLGELLELFRESAPVALKRIEAGLHAANSDDVAGAAHSLKSSCANLGALEMSRLCQETEHAARAGDLAPAAGNLTRLRELFPLVEAELARLAAASAASGA